MTAYPKPLFPKQSQPVPGSQKKMDPYPDCGEQSLLNAVCIWGVGLLVLVTLLVSMILLWFNVLTPEYLRATVS
jgi:hypothetical protein